MNKLVAIKINCDSVSCRHYHFAHPALDHAGILHTGRYESGHAPLFNTDRSTIGNMTRCNTVRRRKMIFSLYEIFIGNVVCRSYKSANINNRCGAHDNTIWIEQENIAVGCQLPHDFGHIATNNTV